MFTFSDKTAMNMQKQSRPTENTGDEADDVFHDVAESQTSQVSSSGKVKVKDIS